MSDVPFIRAAPPHSAPAPRRTADAPKTSSRDPDPRPEQKPAPAVLLNKTVVKAEQIAKYAYGYTFIDAETSQVIARYPAEPLISSHKVSGKVV
ncbi:MAG: hypothetical protein ABUS57_15635 [Pseudomonadota bacterium]